MNLVRTSFWLIISCISINESSKAETYTQMKEIVDKNCTRCHNADGVADFLPFEAFSDIKPAIKKMFDMVKSGKMPKDNPTFNSTAEGTRLLTWLSSGEDLFPALPPPAPPHPIMKDPRELKYEDVKTIIRQNCVGCHNPKGRMPRFPFETFDQVANKASGMFKQLNKRKMPLGNPEFRFTQDGRALLGWLEFGRDLDGAATAPDDGL